MDRIREESSTPSGLNIQSQPATPPLLPWAASAGILPPPILPLFLNQPQAPPPSLIPPINPAAAAVALQWAAAQYINSQQSRNSFNLQTSMPEKVAENNNDSEDSENIL